MNRAVPALAALLLLAGCRRALPTVSELPDFELTAVSAGRPPSRLTRADLAGRVWVADFVFTHCAGPCPALSATMARLQKDLPPGVGLLTFTVDPDRDDAAALSAYGERLRADPARWLFVTGPKARLTDLLVRGFKVPIVEDASAPSGQRVTHSTRLVLLDARARVRGFFDGEDAAAVESLKTAVSDLR